MAKPKPGGRRPRKRERKNVSVGVCALTANWKSLAVTCSLVRTNFDLALDVGLNVAAKVAFHRQTIFDVHTNLVDFRVSQVTHASVWAEFEVFAHLG
jgi:hypothetical protein